jgi:dihydrofolate reductase
MRELVMFNLVSLDGYFEGPNQDISWHNVDAEFNEHAVAMLDSSDLLLFGRITYELMSSVWPTDAAKRDDPQVAGRMNAIPKVVFSRTLTEAVWNNTRLVAGNIEDEVRTLKEQPGKGIALLGSGTIVPQLARSGLIDEYRIMVNPIVLGSGRSLFGDLKGRMALQLAGTRTFRNGNVMLTYRPA